MDTGASRSLRKAIAKVVRDQQDICWRHPLHTSTTSQMFEMMDRSHRDFFRDVLMFTDVELYHE